MLVLEFCCILIVAFYVSYQCFVSSQPKLYLQQYLWLALTSWLGETTMIRAYHFYSYSLDWSLFIDQVPLLIFLIWPVVIHSIGQLFDGFTQLSLTRKSILGALLVLADASLIEPVSVHVGLWQWYAPGLFSVPLIGILGWAYFAGFCLYFWFHPTLSRSLFKQIIGAFIIVGLTHLLLLGTWWGALRWVSCDISPYLGIGVVWLISFFVLIRLIQRQSHQYLLKKQLLIRIPAALFFYVLLLLLKPQMLLFFYAFAFMPPYLWLTLRAPTMK